MKTLALLLALCSTGCATASGETDWWGPIMFGVVVATGALETATAVGQGNANARARAEANRPINCTTSYVANYANTICQ